MNQFCRDPVLDRKNDLECKDHRRFSDREDIIHRYCMRRFYLNIVDHYSAFPALFGCNASCLEYSYSPEVFIYSYTFRGCHMQIYFFTGSGAVPERSGGSVLPTLLKAVIVRPVPIVPNDLIISTTIEILSVRYFFSSFVHDPRT
jgi:hypothetical protein